MLVKIVAVQCLLILAAGGTITGQAKTVHTNRQAQAIELNQRGIESIQAKKFEDARAFYVRAIQLSPHFTDAYENLALLLLLEGSDVQAEQWARQLLALDPQSYNGRLVAGVAALNQDKFARARADLAPLVKVNATDPLPLAAYAIALKNSRATTLASRMNARLSGMRVEERDAVLAAQVFRQPELQGLAQEWLKSAIEESRGEVNPETLYMLASIYASRGRNADAASLYGRILEKNPNNVDALVELSEIERLLGDERKALEHLYAAKKLAATDTFYLVHFSQVCMRRHMYVDARDALQRVVEQDPGNRQAWYQLGLAHNRIGDDEAAIQDFNSALKIDPSDEWSRVGLGAALIGAGREAQAEAQFLRVLKRDAHCGPAYYYLAQIHRDKGRFALAARELQHAVTYAPRDARPLAMLGQLQMEQHDLAAAHTSLKRAIDLDPSSAPAHYNMAMLLRSTGETQRAKQELELYRRYHDEERKKGIVGLVRQGEWDYAGFMPSN